MPTKKPKTTAKKGSVKQSKRLIANLMTGEGGLVTKDQVRSELLAVWDADTWLHLWQVEQAEKSGSTLNDIGIRPIEAESYVNKYNSIIVRNSSKPMLVKPSEAGSWVLKKMTWIIDEVFKRSQA
jgi:hypothetical protein